MKKLLFNSFSTIALVAAVFAFSSCNNSGENNTSGTSTATSTVGTEIQRGAIVYIDLDRILLEYDMANDLGAVVDSKAQNIEAEINRRKSRLESELNSFQDKLNKGLITQSVAEVQYNKLQQEQQEYYEYAQARQDEINEEYSVMMNQILDAVKTYLDGYNEVKGYQMIVANQSGFPVLVADESLDITDDVLLGLNEEYVKEKNKK